MAYVGLKYSLVRQGLDKDYVFQTFADPRNQFLPDVVKKIAYLGKESPDIYKKFMTPEAAARGRAYMEAHRTVLSRAEAKYGVAPEVIVGILTVESGLGNNTGKYPVFNVFASLAVMDTPEVIKEVGLSASKTAEKEGGLGPAGVGRLPGILRHSPPGCLFPERLLGRGHGVLPVSPLQPATLRRGRERQRAGGPVHPRRRHLQHRLLSPQEWLSARQPRLLAARRL